MIYSRVKIPVELVNDDGINQSLWRQLALEIQSSVGYESKYVMEFKKTIEQDDYSTYMIVTLSCDIQHTTTNHYVANTFKQPVLLDYKVSRYERFKQFLFGR